MMKNETLRRALTIWLAAIMALSPSLALASETGEENAPIEEAGASPAEDGETPAEDESPADGGEAADTDAIKYIAIATATLKLRRSAEKINNGIGSIERGDTVYIVELGAQWAKVRTSRDDGYVLTQYLDDIREYNPQTEEAGETVVEPPVFDTAALEDSDGFKENFIAHAVRATKLYEQPSEDSRRIDNIGIYKQVKVSENAGGWSYCKFGDRRGYILTKDLYKWDRINAFAGDIPGQIVYQNIAFVKQTANVYSMKDNDVLNTYPINPGSAICVNDVDEQGRYVTMYWREEAYLRAEDVASVIPVVPWEDAQPGDLLSVMTTFFAVGVSTLNYRGRNWNIYLSSNKITGTVLEPGDEYNMNKKIGPYSKSTGYKSAPIMSPTKLTGYGGGTCQVNTTFYITTVALPLLVTHRRVHCDVGMKYCLKGFDAAVGGGNINLTMINTLPYAIRYQFFISDGVMTCCIFRDH